MALASEGSPLTGVVARFQQRSMPALAHDETLDLTALVEGQAQTEARWEGYRWVLQGFQLEEASPRAAESRLEDWRFEGFQVLAANPRYRFDYALLSPGVMPGQPPRPAPERRQGFDGRQWYDHHIFEQRLTLSDKPLPLDVPPLYATLVDCFRPPCGVVEPLSQALRAGQILGTARLRGETCAVVEAAKGTRWYLSPRRHQPLRYETPEWLVEVESFMEVKPDLWLPRRGMVARYRRGEGTLAQILVFETTLFEEVLAEEKRPFLVAPMVGTTVTHLPGGATTLIGFDLTADKQAVAERRFPDWLPPLPDLDHLLPDVPESHGER